ncbi:hypothetical protein PDO_4654 [Rhizobium sp. PDO1-076]|uniref:FHA domain-containing protein n=1 Tax=Rhizobium sp. PDO1-076 TaxID=1125979 RepID=UPI00024E3910|nr:EscD/YscD/HrpQ family type III secretion system periplasmic domain-containing protein [Rhizobium sp. PDO1-076]EHS52676.1 hypothetical protein PDO_4654 [Rhizobium sp. PDO1-076]
MKHRKKSTQLILKALSGPQSGVEVALAHGEYTLGSGQDDDLQFVDVCLKSGHARIRIEDSKIFVTGGAGSVINEAGLVIDAGDDQWREINPMDILIIGTNTFAIGPTDGHWSDLSAMLDRDRSVDRKSNKNTAAVAFKYRFVRFGFALIGTVVLISGVTWLTVAALMANENTHTTVNVQDVAAVRAALNQFPFGQSIVVRQEVDGTIYATGYVNKTNERLALRDAMEHTGALVNLRLWVLSSIQSQVADAIKSFGVDVTFEVSATGVVTFEGKILSDERAKRFFDYIDDEVQGISSVESKVKTASSYFKEVQDLVDRSGVNDTVILRLFDERIEASGLVVTNKIDGWIGFIHAYARHYADHIPLTSYVQVVNEQGTVVAKPAPTRLGPPGHPNAPGTTDLDLTRLKQGDSDFSDIFLTPLLEIPNKLVVAAREPSQLVPAPETAPATDDQKHADTPSNEKSNLSNRALTLLSPPQAVGAGDSKGQDDTTNQVLKNWDENIPNAGEPNQSQGSARQRYLPLILSPIETSDLCWAGSGLHIADVPAILFWLDYLSLSQTVSLIDFERPNQLMLLEAALNPDRTRQCAKKLADQTGIHLDAISSYLRETEHNPFFVRYLVRDFATSELDVAGVMLRDNDRFIQTDSGAKIREGSSPNLKSKLISIGSLGALLQQEDAVAPLIYSESLTWKVTSE